MNQENRIVIQKGLNASKPMYTIASELSKCKTYAPSVSGNVGIALTLSHSINCSRQDDATSRAPALFRHCRNCETQGDETLQPDKRHDGKRTPTLHHRVGSHFEYLLREKLNVSKEQLAVLDDDRVRDILNALFSDLFFPLHCNTDKHQNDTY